MASYVMQTFIGATPSLGLGFGLGANAVLVYINLSGSTKRACYALLGISAGLSAVKGGVFTLWSSPSEFESLVGDASQFQGWVGVYDRSGGVGAQYGYTVTTWTTGPAKGTVCEGFGWSAAISAGWNVAMYGIQYLVFLGWDDNKAGISTMGPAYSTPMIK